MQGNSPGGVSTWWSGLPMGVRGFFLLNVSVYCAGLVLPPSWALSSRNAASHLCMQAALVASNPMQGYRIFTSAFTHGGLMHIGWAALRGPNKTSLVLAHPTVELMRSTVFGYRFNMVAFSSSGPPLERLLGARPPARSCLPAQQPEPMAHGSAEES